MAQFLSIYTLYHIYNVVGWEPEGRYCCTMYMVIASLSGFFATDDVFLWSSDKLIRNSSMITFPYEYKNTCYKTKTNYKYCTAGVYSAFGSNGCGDARVWSRHRANLYASLLSDVILVEKGTHLSEGFA